MSDEELRERAHALLDSWGQTCLHPEHNNDCDGLFEALWRVRAEAEEAEAREWLDTEKENDRLAAEAAQLRQRVEELSGDLYAERKALEAMTVDRDAYRKAKAENDERFMTERDEARYEVGRLSQRVADLAEFAQHKPWCDKVSGEPDCDCGLDSAMAFAEPPADPPTVQGSASVGRGEGRDSGPCPNPATRRRRGRR